MCNHLRSKRRRPWQLKPAAAWPGSDTVSVSVALLWRPTRRSLLFASILLLYLLLCDGAIGNSADRLKYQEVLGRINRLLSLIRHRPHWKRLIQQFFYCSVCISYSGNVSTDPSPSNYRGFFTESLPSNDKGIFTEPLPSNDKGIFTDPLRGNDKGIFTDPLPSNSREILPSRCLATIRGLLPSPCLATIGEIHRRTHTHTHTTT
jgi:hypothetical protein